MRKAKKMTRTRDVGVFKKTYNRTKRINHASATQNGGIRL